MNLGFHTTTTDVTNEHWTFPSPAFKWIFDSDDGLFGLCLLHQKKLLWSEPFAASATKTGFQNFYRLSENPRNRRRSTSGPILGDKKSRKREKAAALQKMFIFTDANIFTFMLESNNVLKRIGQKWKTPLNVISILFGSTSLPTAIGEISRGGHRVKICHPDFS